MLTQKFGKIQVSLITCGIIPYKYIIRRFVMLTRSIPTKFDEQDFDRLNYIAKLYDRSVSYLIREATREYLDAQAKKLEFLEEARLSFANYKDSGLHVTHQEMKAWLGGLSKGENIGKPKCHK